MNRNGFLSSRIDLRRIGAGVASGAISIATAMMSFTARPCTILVGLALLGVAAYVLFQSWAGHQPIPDIAEDQPSFQVSFPAAIRGVGYLVLVIVCFGFVIFVARVGPPIASELSGATRFFFIAFVLLMGAVCLALIYVLTAAFGGNTTQSLSAEEGFLIARRPFQRVRLSLHNLRATRILVSETGKPKSLFLRSGQTAVWIEEYPKCEKEQRLFDQICAWLRARDVAVDMEPPLVPFSYLRFLGRTTLFTGIVLLCIFLPPGFVIAGAFWVQWFHWGVFNPFISIEWGFFFGFFVGSLVVLSPMRGWIHKMIQFAWLRQRTPPVACNVAVTNASGPTEMYRSGTGRGRLLLEHDFLVLRVGKSVSRIRSGQIVELRQLSGLSRFECVNIERILATPVLISWRREDGLVHSVCLISRHGWSAGRDRWYDKKLYETLDKWRRGETLGPDPLATQSPGPRWLSFLLATAFLVLGFGLPPLHNHVIRQYIATGLWQPPVSIRPKGLLWPSVLSIEAVRPGPIDFRECDYTADGTTTKPVSVPMGRSWVGDPFNGKKDHWIESARPEMIFGYPSRPGGAYVFEMDNSVLGMALVPPRIGSGSFPPQIVSIATGHRRNVPSLPKGQFPGTVALYEDKRVFWACPVDGSTSAPCDIAWVDVQNDKCHVCHFLKRMMSTDKDYFSPVFFPGGRYVLFSWTVIALDSDERKAVKRPDPPTAESPPYWAPPWGLWHDVFEAGDRLRIYVVHRNENRSYSDKQVWEIDPLTAQLAVIARFPDNTRLIGADGDRWLLRESSDDGKEEILKLYDHQTKTSRALFRAAENERYALVAGNPQLLVWSVKSECSVRSIDGMANE